jgi:toxin FitB
MILLDTNALSEALKPVPLARVLDWISAHEAEGVFVSAITEAEVLSGIEVLPAGKRKQALAVFAGKLFEGVLRGKILPFDEEAARLFASIWAARKAAGRPISQFDAMIAAIARAHGATLATRNVKDFEHCGIRLVNPWADVH